MKGLRIVGRKKKILFVDEEPQMLRALQRSFRKYREEWEPEFVENAAGAMEVLSSKSFDILITETRFKGMGGLELLEKVRERFPKIARIILSGYTDRDVILKSTGIAHQYLSKPCDDDDIKSAINKALMIRDLLKNDSLKSVVSKIDSLPSLPSLYMEIVSELRSDDPSIQKVGEIVARDLGMTAKILQLVNSSFFGLPQRVSTAETAVTLLGIDIVKAIALTSGAFSKFERAKFPGFSVDALWNHGLKTGGFSKVIAQNEKLERKIADAGFMAGLLHDIGKVLIAANFPEIFSQIAETSKNRGMSFYKAELELMGATHAEVGAYLLGLWGLPENIVEAVAFHHNPQMSKDVSISPLTVIHAANGIEKGLERTLSAEPSTDDLDLEYMEALGLSQRIPAWTEACASHA
jgi:HD-like signal output (HDOD) protein/CheY-like chemotaxis protein